MDFDENLFYLVCVVAFIAVFFIFFIYFKSRKSNENMETVLKNVVCDGEKCVRN